MKCFFEAFLPLSELDILIRLCDKSIYQLQYQHCLQLILCPQLYKNYGLIVSSRRELCDTLAYSLVVTTLFAYIPGWDGGGGGGGGSKRRLGKDYSLSCFFPRPFPSNTNGNKCYCLATAYNNYSRASQPCQPKLLLTICILLKK